MKTLNDFIGQEVTLQLMFAGSCAGIIEGKLEFKSSNSYCVRVNERSQISFNAESSLFNQDYYNNAGKPYFIIGPAALLDEIKKHWDRE